MVHLRKSGARDGVILLSGMLDAGGTVQVRYPTRTGALLRVDGEVEGAFDREHESIVIEAATGAQVLMEVEERSLPTNGLPSGPGISWWWLNRQAAQAPSLQLEARSTQEQPFKRTPSAGVPLIGHSHLDVAWLWTYAQTERKAMRTFAIAKNLLERFPEFIFSQSQPQLYAFVEESDPAFFQEVAALVQTGRFDASIAAMWVEPDCNLPSGESLLRQMLFADAYCTERFAVRPQVAWLPDTFGFANTLPTLLDHAGIKYFATTKLRWNDTTQFPYPQFVWRGPDGSDVTGALIASYDGGLGPERLRLACERQEPVVAGFGDGGGGVTEEMIGDARKDGYWVRPLDWFQTVDSRRDRLPIHQGELYLEYHRGVYTTHHDIKARNAELERRLERAEEAAAWCQAVRSPRDLHAAFRANLNEAWRIVLRNQFHDVLPGTSIGAVYDDVHAEYDTANGILEGVLKGTSSVLPRARAALAPPRMHEPQLLDDGAYAFQNGMITARVSAAGIIGELAGPDGRNCVSQANVLALYNDRPEKWEAWNIDAAYDKRVLHPKHGTGSIAGGELVVPFQYKKSTFAMRISLRSGEPFLRVELDCDWRTTRTLLRVENWLPIRAGEVTYGAPHGTVVRGATASTPQDRAKYEVPGQRFAMAADSQIALGIFALDTYGWSARTLPKGGIHIGHSLLRGTVWPDPAADQGVHAIRYAFAPCAGAGIGALEVAWWRFAHEPRVRLFVPEQENVLVVACKPAQDGDGVILRIRECDGHACMARIRSAGRVKSIHEIDALEREREGTLSIQEEMIVAPIGPFALRSFRVRFS
ncbi:MAG: alpha-mannosidase [Candidatus Eremiobacteraeota bacterium]|nr:alpha-mannosidase [Candidatus Eremiobacteraeota bacterium]